MTTITPRLHKKLLSLRELAAPFEVDFARNPNTVPVPLFRVSLPGDMFLEGTGNEVQTALQKGAIGDVQQTIEWAAGQGLTLVPAKWRGLGRFHDFYDEQGQVVSRTPAGTAEFLIRQRAPFRLGQVRRAALRKGLQLLSTEWTGEASKYRFQAVDGKIHELKAKDLVPGMQVPAARRATRSRAAEPAPMPPQVIGAPPQKKVFKATVAHEAPVLGTHEYLAGLVFERSRIGLNYVFKLPDGTKVEAGWSKMLDAVDVILDRKALDPAANCEVIETGDCIELRKMFVGG